MAELRRTVFVAVHNGGREGYSAPMAVFATREFALVYLAGSEAGQSDSVEIYELPVHGTTLGGVIAPIECHPRLFTLPTKD